MATSSGLLALPEGCITDIIYETSPRDACRLACVSTAYRSAVDSDSVWDRFLPPQYLAAVPASLASSLSKKELYLRACHSPVLIKDGKLSFWLDKPSGKNCYMLSARELKIVWGDSPEYWAWVSVPDARFPEVPELRDVCWFDLSGKITTSILSPRTTYVFYIVLKPVSDDVYGFENNPVEVTVGLADGDDHKRTVYFNTKEGDLHSEAAYYLGYSSEDTEDLLVDEPAHGPGYFLEERGDRWFECELGEYFYGGDEETELSITIMETKRGNWKSGFIFQGIEIRPKRELTEN